MNNFKSLTILLLTFSFTANLEAQEQNWIEKEVSFQNGDITLNGVYLKPKTNDLVPAIVYLHGSGTMTKEGFRPYAEKFVQLGIASLFYDKRGSGNSEGSWITSSIDDLADDAVAAINFLKEQGSIDPKRIGFWGISQGGWIAPIAAEKSNDISFMILVSGGGASPRDSELYSYKMRFAHMGLSSEEQEEGLKIATMFLDYLGTGKDRNLLTKNLESLKGGKLEFLSSQINSILPSEKNRRNWSWVGNYDPINEIQKLDCSLLLLFGDKDYEHPTNLAIKLWKKGLELNDANLLTAANFSGAGHGIRMGHHNGNQRPPFADGYWEVQIGWLWNNVINK